MQCIILNQIKVVSVLWWYGWQYLQTIYWVCTLSTVLACWGLPAWALQQYRSQAPPSTCSNTHSAHACSIYSFCCGPCDMIPAPTLLDDSTICLHFFNYLCTFFSKHKVRRADDVARPNKIKEKSILCHPRPNGSKTCCILRLFKVCQSFAMTVSWMSLTFQLNCIAA